MKKTFLFLICISVILLAGCKEDELEVSPAVPFTIELNQTEYHLGDSLYGKVVINTSELTSGTTIEKIDCRLGNIVIGTTVNQMSCPFGVRLKDKPIGTHTFSVIIKCQSPNCDLTFWRTDYKMIEIKE